MKLLGRNDPCHCGSGKKYKKCCIQKDEEKSRLENLAQKEPVVQEGSLPVFKSRAQESPYKQENLPQEDENITKLWNELKKLNYPDDASKSLAIIESFIKNFPHLAQESYVIDEMFSLEGCLYTQNRTGEYITLLEKIELYAPEFYIAEAGWFDVPRLQYTIATRQKKNIAPLLVNFKKNPLKNVDNLSEAIELLAWAGADDELHELVKDTYKTLTDSNEILNSDFVNEWIYFEIYYTTSRSSMSVDDCSDKIIELMTKAYEPIDSEQPFNKEFITKVVRWIREDIFEWDCPFENEEKTIDFFICMGWQFFKYINKVSCNTPYQNRFIQQQLFHFWMYFKSEKKPKPNYYCITKDRIEKFTRTLSGIEAVAFLQAVWYYMDYLYFHDRIEKQPCDDLKTICTNLYTNQFSSDYDCYPATVLITEFPKMESKKSERGSWGWICGS